MPCLNFTVPSKLLPAFRNLQFGEESSVTLASRFAVAHSKGTPIGFHPAPLFAMPDRRGRSYREWSSNESESEESESDSASEQAPLPPRARTLAVEPSPFTVTSTQAAMPFALDVSAILHVVSDPR